MASSQSPSMILQDVKSIMADVEELMEENRRLDEKMEALAKQKKENSSKVFGLITTVKSLRMEGSEVIDDQERFDDSPGEENCVSVKDLQEELKSLRMKIQESTKNLLDHKKLLEDLEKENVRDQYWQDQFNNVDMFTALHQKYKQAKEMRIVAIQQELKRGSGKKKVLKEKFVLCPVATTSAGVGSSTSKSRFAVKRKLNESVIDCGEIVKKIPTKEKEAMVPKVLKVEEAPSDSPYDCNFASCKRSFTSAAPLASHLEKHYALAEEKFDCPFPTCQFVATQENLTKHMRSQHTKEQLFTCSYCTIKFHTMNAKMSHEKKHSQQDVWAQCDKEDCLRFYQVTRGNCRFCVKK